MVGDDPLTPLAVHGNDKAIILLDRTTGTYSQLDQPKPFQHGAAGVAFVLRSGLLRPVSILLALIADGQTLWLRLGSEEFDLQDPTIRVHKSLAIPFVRVFRVWRSRTLCASLVYWARLPAEDSMVDDFPGFVTAIAGANEEILRALVRWRATASGRDISRPDVRRELEEEFTTLHSARNASGMP